ncbi:MAG: hypothetical protein WBK65_08905 [Thermotogota bacterium]
MKNDARIVLHKEGGGTFRLLEAQPIREGDRLEQRLYRVVSVLPAREDP